MPRSFKCPHTGEPCERGDCLLGFCLDSDNAKADAGRRAFRKTLLDPTLQAPRAVVRIAIARQKEIAQPPPRRQEDAWTDALMKKLEDREAWLARMRGRKGASS
jgi:hypothetical protein